jgi:hypothetical protein
MSALGESMTHRPRGSRSSAIQGNSEGFMYSSAEPCAAVRVRTLSSEPSASANLAMLSSFIVSTKATRSLSPLMR